MKKVAVFIIILLMLFSFTACMGGYVFSFCWDLMSDRHNEPIVSTVNEYLTNNTLSDEYELTTFNLKEDPQNEDNLTIESLDVIKTKTSKEFLYTEEKSMVDEDTTDYKPGDLYTNAKYFDGKKLYYLDGITKKITSETAKWEDYDYDKIPDIIRSNINEIIAKAKVKDISHFIDDPESNDLNYQITITYDEKQINKLKIFDGEVTYFEIYIMTNKDVTEIGNIIVTFAVDTNNYTVIFGKIEKSPDEITLKEQFDCLKYENDYDDYDDYEE